MLNPIFTCQCCCHEGYEPRPWCTQCRTPHNPGQSDCGDSHLDWINFGCEHCVPRQGVSC